MVLCIIYATQDNSGAVLQYDKFVIEDGAGELFNT